MSNVQFAAAKTGALWRSRTQSGALRKGDLNIARVVRRGNESPADLAIIPMVQEVADRLLGLVSDPRL
jgi:hypothetical protein